MATTKKQTEKQETKLDDKTEVKIDTDKINNVQNKEKKCHKCNIVKSIENFSKHKTTADGYDNRCRDCVKILRDSIKKKLKEENKLLTAYISLQQASQLSQ